MRHLEVNELALIVLRVVCPDWLEAWLNRSRWFDDFVHSHLNGNGGPSRVPADWAGTLLRRQLADDFTERAIPAYRLLTEMERDGELVIAGSSQLARVRLSGPTRAAIRTMPN